MKEPPRQTSLALLAPYVRERVEKVLVAMKARGFDPIVFESARTETRQRWLYGVGRTHSLRRKPITWTLNSLHIPGKAVDIISKKRKWDWPAFFTALAQEGRKVGLHSIKAEGCHMEWRG